MLELREAVMQAIADTEAENAQMTGEEPPEIAVKIRDKFKSAIHAQSMFDPNLMGAISEALDRHIWVIGHNISGHTLYTSGHPVARHAHMWNPVLSMSGIDSPGIEIAFPLTPTYLLSMLHRETFKAAEIAENTVLEIAGDNVSYYNEIQVSSSHRQVYCSHDDFDLAAEICRNARSFGTQKGQRCRSTTAAVYLEPHGHNSC